MSLLDETESIARKTMTVFFVIDTSGSMIGSKIGAVNDAMENLIPIIRDISDSNPDAEIKMAVLEFATGAEWLYDEPKTASNFQWRNLTADGLTSLGGACLALNDKLSKSHGFMKAAKGSYAPVIILMSDGAPTDDFKSGLSTLKKNNWFKHATKCAIAIGDNSNGQEGADIDVLAEFTGSREAVVTVHNIEALKKIIRLITVTSTQVASTSTPTGEKSKQDQVNDSINEQTEGMDGVNDTFDEEFWT